MQGKILSIEQGTLEWHQLRKDCIGASDFAVIAANNNYCKNLFGKTLASLANDKKNGNYKDNVFMKKGRELEPILRRKIQEEYNLFIEPLVFQSSDLDFCIASLDGYDFKKNGIIEIKTTSKNKIKYQEQIDYYIWQLIHQYFCIFEKEDTHPINLFIYNLIDESIEIIEGEKINDKFYFKSKFYSCLKHYPYDAWKEDCKRFKTYLNSIKTAENDYKELIKRYDNVETQIEKLIEEKNEIRNELIMKFPEGGDLGNFKIVKKINNEYDYERYFRANNLSLNEFVKPDYKGYIMKNNIELPNEFMVNKKISYSIIRSKK